MTDLSKATLDSIADFIELTAIALFPRPLSIVEARTYAKDHVGVPELRLDGAFRHLAKRKELLASRYPFTVAPNYVVATTSAVENTYISLLLLSGPSPLRDCKAWSMHQSGKTMEVVVESAFSEFYGTGTKSVNFGFPSDINRPADFGEAVAWLSRQTGIPLGSGYRAARFKDGGVDIFVWKSFLDQRPGVPIMLLQSTIQMDFLGKIGDVDRRLWSSWLSSDIDPIVGLCVPAVVGAADTWAEITTRGILFDRIRLVSISPSETWPATLTQKAYFEQLIGQFAAGIK